MVLKGESELVYMFLLYHRAIGRSSKYVAPDSRQVYFAPVTDT